jgi:hypothetical protein
LPECLRAIAREVVAGFCLSGSDISSGVTFTRSARPETQIGLPFSGRPIWTGGQSGFQQVTGGYFRLARDWRYSPERLGELSNTGALFRATL